MSDLSGKLYRKQQVVDQQLKLASHKYHEAGGKKKYRYTLDNDLLSESQRDFYEENGFLVVKKLIDPSHIKGYKDRFVDICRKRVDVGNMTVMKDINLRKMKGISPEYVVNKVQGYQADPVLSSYFRLPEILKYVECFVGRDIDAVHTMLINKPPDAGAKSSRHPFHQDLHYFPFRPADRIVATWTAMQKITRENGCLVVFPGTHKGELLKHGYPMWDGGVNKAYHGVVDLDTDVEKVYLNMEEGDTVFFHPILIHGSGSNTSKEFRKAISCHFSTSHKDYIDVRGTDQEEIGQEVEDMAKKKFPGAEVSFQDVFRLKSVTVQMNGAQSML